MSESSDMFPILPHVRRCLTVHGAGKNTEFTPHPLLEELGVHGSGAALSLLHNISTCALRVLRLKLASSVRSFRPVNLPPTLERLEMETGEKCPSEQTTTQGFLQLFFSEGQSVGARQSIQTVGLGGIAVPHDINLSETLPGLQTVCQIGDRSDEFTIYLDPENCFWLRPVHSLWSQPRTVEASRLLGVQTRTVSFALTTETGWDDDPYYGTTHAPIITSLLAVDPHIFDHAKHGPGLVHLSVDLPTDGPSLFLPLQNLPNLQTLALSMSSVHTQAFVHTLRCTLQDLHRALRRSATTMRLLRTFHLYVHKFDYATIMEDEPKACPCLSGPLSLEPWLCLLRPSCKHFTVISNCDCIRQKLP